MRTRAQMMTAIAALQEAIVSKDVQIAALREWACHLLVDPHPQGALIPQTACPKCTRLIRAACLL